MKMGVISSFTLVTQWLLHKEFNKEGTPSMSDVLCLNQFLVFQPSMTNHFHTAGPEGVAEESQHSTREIPDTHFTQIPTPWCWMCIHHHLRLEKQPGTQFASSNCHFHYQKVGSSDPILERLVKAIASCAEMLQSRPFDSMVAITYLVDCSTALVLVSSTIALPSNTFCFTWLQNLQQTLANTSRKAQFSGTGKIMVITSTNLIFTDSAIAVTLHQYTV